MTTPNQSTSGTNQSKDAHQASQSQPGMQQQPGQGKPQDQQQQQNEPGHPPGATQGDNPDRQSGSSKS